MQWHIVARNKDIEEILLLLLKIWLSKMSLEKRVHLRVLQWLGVHAPLHTLAL